LRSLWHRTMSSSRAISVKSRCCSLNDIKPPAATRPILGRLSKQSTDASAATAASSACGRAGTTSRRRRIAHRASARGCQRLGTGASDRSSGRARTRLPSVPWTRPRGRWHAAAEGSSPTQARRSRAPLSPSSPTDKGLRHLSS
jgi:hypothetical protein